MKSFQQNNKQGFTIVELLIVIVVIGILAAITIVAYNGIQTRAENIKTISAIEKYATALSAYSTTNNSYPSVPLGCLGGVSSCAQVTDGAATCFGTGGASNSSTLDTAIKTVITTLPSLSNQQISCGGKSYVGGFFGTNDGKTAVIYYFLRGNQTCTSTASLAITSSTYQGDATQCIGSLPTLP